VSEQTKHYLSLRVGQQWYGIDVSHIKQVLHFMELTELPGTPPDILGLLTLRDQVMPVIDLRQRFGLADALLKLDTPIIAIDTDEGPLALIADDVDEVEAVDHAQISAQARTASPYVTGAFRTARGLLLLLDIALIHAETQLPEPPPDAA
jgi:purine-binding chemotaxis protein CheW